MLALISVLLLLLEFVGPKELILVFTLWTSKMIMLARMLSLKPTIFIIEFIKVNTLPCEVEVVSISILKCLYL